MSNAALIAPGSAIANSIYRSLMLHAATRFAVRRDRSSCALGRALRTAATGRARAPERAWIERVEAARSRLASDVRAMSEVKERDPADHLEEAQAAVQWMSVPPILGRLLFRIVRELEPLSSLELGTGFGVSTSYQAAALELNQRGRLTSLDVEAMIALASPGLTDLGLAQRVDLVGGAIEQTLAPTLAKLNPIDYLLLDADHTEAGTLGAFEAILPRLATGAVAVVDDINWTPGMRRAWTEIKRHESVAAAINLRRLGIVVIGENRTGSEF